MTAPIQSERVIPPLTLEWRLRMARALTGLNTIDFGREIGLSATSVTNAETGRTRPRRPTIIAWAFVCGVDLDWLEHGADSRTPR